MTKGTVWITRTEPGAGHSARRLKNAGFKTVIAPLMAVAPASHVPEYPDPEALLIITSQNAARYLGEWTDQRHWPVLTVGDATANYVRRLGFEDVRSASGTWVDIARVVKKHLRKDKPINHICGASWRGPLVETLSEAGFNAKRIVIYQTNAAQALPDIDYVNITHAGFYSPKAARILAALNPDLSHMTAVSISAATDNALGNLSFKRRLVSEYPTESSMLAALGA